MEGREDFRQWLDMYRISETAKDMCVMAYVDTINGISEYVNSHNEKECIAVINYFFEEINVNKVLADMVIGTNLEWVLFGVCSAWLSLFERLDLY